MDIAGIAISGVNLLTNLHAKYQDFSKWQEGDVEVTLDWLEVALERRLLAGKPEDFAWIHLRRLPTAELKGTHSAVIAYNENRRLRYRVVCGAPEDRLILTQRLQLPPKG